MKKIKVLKFKEKLKKILITVICIITVFFSMPVKSSADAGILESIGSFILLIPDGIQLLLNSFVSDETEDMKFFIRLSITDYDANIFANSAGSLYNIEVTPYDIFTSGTPTVYGKYVEANGEASDAINNFSESIENSKNGAGDMSSVVQAGRDAQDAVSNLESMDIGEFTTKSLVKMPLLDANFFKKSTGDSSNSADILRPIVAGVYKNLRNFVLVIMLLILLYVGIRIIISSAVAEQVKYKQYLVNWIVGICLIFLMQYIMSAIMYTTKIVDDMLVTSVDGETYRIGFGTADTKAAAAVRSIAKVNNTFFNNKFSVGLRTVIETTTNPIIGIPNAIASVASSGKVNIYKIMAQNFSAGCNILADKVNSGKGDRWSELASSKDEKVSNFMGRKVQVANNGAIFAFDEKNKTVSDYYSDIIGTPTKVNAGIYDGKVRGFRAIYTCNIAEFCRTITTFSTKYTHLYTNNKSSVMTDSENEKENDYASAAFWGYAFLYVLITIETVVFLYKYLKRVLWLAFLTMIAPLIAVMYPVDKLGDGKAQTFNMWFKEYLFNSLIQPLHILLYTIFIGLGMQLLSTNVIYGIVAYAFMIPAEKFFKKMFGFDKAATPGTLGSPAAGMMAMRGLDKIGGFGPHGKGKGGKTGATDSSGRSKINFAKNKLGTPMDSIGGANSAKTSGKGANSAVVNLGGKSTESVPNSGINANGRKKGNFSGALSRFGGRIVGMGSTAGNRIARKITGGKTSNLGKALFSPKGWAAMAANGGKFAGRNAIRIAGGTLGAIAGTGAGLVAGGLASALTGEDQLVKGASTGAAIGGNRGVQTAESFRGAYNDLNESGKEYLASVDADYAAKLQAQEIFEENGFMGDSDRDRIQDVLLAGASKDEVTKSLDKILKSNDSAEAVAFKAHLNNKFDLDTQKGYEEAVNTYSQKLKKGGNKPSQEQIDIKKEKIKNDLDKQQENIQNNKDYSKEDRTELLDKVEQRRQNIDKLAEAECYKDMASKIVDQGIF